jgi:hypothetical protein
VRRHHPALVPEEVDEAIRLTSKGSPWPQSVSTSTSLRAPYGERFTGRASSSETPTAGNPALIRLAVLG